jgi:hypothetical protein
LKVLHAGKNIQNPDPIAFFNNAKSPMSEIELQIQGNFTLRKHVDGHQLQPSSEKPASDHAGDVVDTVTGAQHSTALSGPTMTKTQVKTARIQLLALAWTMFMLGWNDGSLGPLLPRIQEVYHVYNH